jgi:hypothetical protein
MFKSVLDCARTDKLGVKCYAELVSASHPIKYSSQRVWIPHQVRKDSLVVWANVIPAEAGIHLLVDTNGKNFNE